MNDKQTRYFVLTCALALLLYWMSKPKMVAGNSTVIPASTDGGFINDPNLQAYNPGTGFQSVSPDINISIGNQGLNYLNNNYIPLFGFVGMAQGETYH